ncbi:DUF2808 domain-containing protein [Chlorogloeopsis sp. ULAP02]|uniref:DUF2808 domain-containing protein n=1 Tax=Chlorogloeopsis sp. ULAP02 TaxID=3107926 RepID=UPI003135E558
MKSILSLCKTLLVGTGLCLLYVPATNSLVSAQAPRLLSAETTYNQTSVREATYYFTLTVPESASAPLQQVSVTQIRGLEAIGFDERNSTAFEGTGDRRGQKLGITLAKSDRQQRTATITFDQPVAPGKTITIGLKPLRNPNYEGVYLFQVQTLPTGKQTDNYVIGTARLQFYGIATNE